jgi:hypothetical protein
MSKQLKVSKDELSEVATTTLKFRELPIKERIAIYKNIIPVNGRILLEPIIEEEFRGKLILSPDYEKYRIDVKVGDRVLGAKRTFRMKLNDYYIEECAVHDITMIVK